MKTCRVCELVGESELFAKTANICSGCEAARCKAYYASNKDKHKATASAWKRANPAKVKSATRVYCAANKEKASAATRAWQKTNPDKARAWKRANPDKASATTRAWREANPDRVKAAKKAWHKVNYNVCPQFTLSSKLRSRLNSALKNNYKAGSAVADLGCSIDRLLIYLNLSCFMKYGVTYSDSAGEFHIDHIKPLRSFDLTDREQLLQAISWRNLQILSSTENLAKSGTYVRPLLSLPPSNSLMAG